jgi:2'-hydroxyisoflavone reductase
MSSRRRFVGQIVALSGALSLGGGGHAADTPPGKLRVLILGGTGAIGPFHVRAAVARGHHVAVFSRGKTHADLPRSVERLIGDRNGDLQAIANRDWDAVIDIAAFGPGWVRSLAEALGRRVRHYTFISTVSVYDNPSADHVTTEDSPVIAYTGKADPYAVVTHVGEDYGALKVLCEREAEQRFSGRTLVLRPGYIGGPGDLRALTYWAVRADKGRDMLAGGDPATPVQYLDVRDLAEWVIRLAERRVTGTYNAVGPSKPLTLAQLVEGARAALAPRGTATWVPAQWLLSQPDPERWGTLLFWSRSVGPIMHMSNQRALAQGLTTRPLAITLRETLDWYKAQPDATKASLITGFRRNADGSWSENRSSWSDYLAREQELIRTWRAQQR